MKKLFNKDINTYINYLIIIYAFSFPVSKAAVNIIEVLAISLWLYQGTWAYKIELLKSSKFLIIIFAFILYNIISIIWASDTTFAINFVSKYHHYLMIPVIYTALEKRYIKYIFSAFVSGVLISEIMSYGIYFKLFTYGHATPEFPTPFMQHITYSVVLAFTGTILLTNFFIAKELKYKAFNILFFITVTANLFINGGRTGQVVYIVLMFILMLAYTKNKFNAIMSAAILVSITLFLAYNFSNNFSPRIDQFKNGVMKVVNHNDFTGQGGVRASLWFAGSEVFLNNFFVGTGIGDAMNDANHYIKRSGLNALNMNQFSDYDNTFITIAARLGLIGLLMVLMIFYTLYKLKFSSKQYHVLNIIFITDFVLFSIMHETLHLMNPMVYFSLFSGLFSGISRIESVSCTKKSHPNSNFTANQYRPGDVSDPQSLDQDR